MGLGSFPSFFIVYFPSVNKSVRVVLTAATISFLFKWLVIFIGFMGFSLQCNSPLVFGLGEPTLIYSIALAIWGSF